MIFYSKNYKKLLLLLYRNLVTAIRGFAAKKGSMFPFFILKSFKMYILKFRQKYIFLCMHYSITYKWFTTKNSYSEFLFNKKEDSSKNIKSGVTSFLQQTLQLFKIVFYHFLNQKLVLLLLLFKFLWAIICYF